MPVFDSEGHELSEYEVMRLERIAKNKAFLEELGLGSTRAKLQAEATEATKRNASRRKKAAAASRVKPGEERRSPRFSSNDASSLVMLSYDDDGEEIVKKQKNDGDYEDDNDDDHFPVSDSPVRSRRFNINKDDWEMTDEERSALVRNVDGSYLAKFKEFLMFHNKISEQNVRSVMRQVGKLARGEGVRYESKQYGWQEDCFFMKGKKITPTSDIVQLMEEAQQCEDKWGRDHGNGWLLSHPLKKLLLFQQFALNNLDFLTARCKLGDYYALDDDLDSSPENVVAKVAAAAESKCPGGVSVPKENHKQLAVKKTPSSVERTARKRTKKGASSTDAKSSTAVLARGSTKRTRSAMCKRSFG